MWSRVRDECSLIAVSRTVFLVTSPFAPNTMIPAALAASLDVHTVHCVRGAPRILQ